MGSDTNNDYLINDHSNAVARKKKLFSQSFAPFNNKERFVCGKVKNYSQKQIFTFHLASFLQKV